MLHIYLKNCFVLMQRRRKQKAVSAPPLLGAPGNDPVQETKGTMQGQDSFCHSSVCVQAWHCLPESTRRAAVRESCSLQAQRLLWPVELVLLVLRFAF